jgi:hypothetical protein
MDIDTRWPYHRKCRALQASHPTDWPSYWCAYLALLGESWAGTDRVSLRDAWVPSLPVTLDAAQAALTEVGLLDKTGKVPTKSWDEWFGPAMARIDSFSERGRKGAERRWGKRDKHPSSHSPSNGTAMAQPSASNAQAMHHANHASQPTTPATDARYGLPHITDLSRDVAESITGMGILSAGEKQLTEWDRLVEFHGEDKVAEAFRRVAGGKRVTYRQLVWDTVKALEPFAKPTVIEGARKDQETEADWEARVAATRKQTDWIRRHMYPEETDDAA